MPDDIDLPFDVIDAAAVAAKILQRNEQKEAAAKAKEEAGRYTLEEAGQLIEKETGERGDEMTKRLMAAALSGALPVYEPGKNAPYQYGEDFASRPRQWYEEAHWDDLNTWLAENARRITFRFPAPSVTKRKGHPPTPAFAPVGITSAEIIEKFRLDDNWVEKLRKPNTYQFLKPALTQRGQRGGEQHRWNPAKFGEILVARKERNQLAVSTVIFQRFPAWSDEWQAILDAT